MIWRMPAVAKHLPQRHAKTPYVTSCRVFSLEAKAKQSFLCDINVVMYYHYTLLYCITSLYRCHQILMALFTSHRLRTHNTQVWCVWFILIAKRKKKSCVVNFPRSFTHQKYGFPSHPSHRERRFTIKSIIIRRVYIHVTCKMRYLDGEPSTNHTIPGN